ncbi:hypothetical protein B7R22_16830 [Subtercola boreus]|uniref:Stress-response A/B barrel domain-containing protein n=1 Tax=Subtercola boreus TaxID=120213 RepID=A0A3E0VR68_9MICO|nr:Dabb family protein [Subtercola boreus]RFA12099.1 hypothetical protein B7R22_16830 [Subtercola boreus]
MIAHLVTFRFRDGVTDQSVSGLTKDLEAMAANMPFLNEYSCGPNLRLRANGVDFGVLAIVQDAAALDRYLDSPDHHSVLDRWADELFETRQSVQLFVGA